MQLSASSVGWDIYPVLTRARYTLCTHCITKKENTEIENPTIIFRLKIGLCFGTFSQKMCRDRLWIFVTARNLMVFLTSSPNFLLAGIIVGGIQMSEDLSFAVEWPHHALSCSPAFSCQSLSKQCSGSGYGRIMIFFRTHRIRNNFFIRKKEKS